MHGSLILRRSLVLLLLSGGTASGVAQQRPAAAIAPLPNKDRSFKFAVLGDFGTGDRSQYELAAQMVRLHQPLLDAGVRFYASLGNHDAREQRFYKLFNMDGKLYYTFSPMLGIRFFALEAGWKRSWHRRAASGRSRSSTTRCIRRASGTARTSACARCWSRSFSSTT